ncbi:DddA-like double-stranded DNA deaminase toxin [Amycolatopsis sp. NBC_01286]|uniref:DddA-like double-stranded DNA deaminase toxin n=1 Tax=Amycolatopsis sp. NBC_01286 TaxID=2903560 RepID=UPI002E1382F1|nr:hypothetical protein OG570_09570 [Amycolatopsis sp. NBC_01286]
MSDVEKFAAELDVVVERVERAIAAMAKAGAGLDEAATDLAKVTQGTKALSVEQAQAFVVEARRGISALSARLDTVSRNLAAYRVDLAGPPVVAPIPAKPPVEPATVTASRAELPPPVRVGKGDKTHGLWSAAGSGEQSRLLISGKRKTDEEDPDEPSFAEVQAYFRKIGLPPYAIASHVEAKLAVRMAKTGLRDVTVTLNHVPCPGKGGCDEELENILPNGFSLSVYGESGDGKRFFKRYTGRSK